MSLPNDAPLKKLQFYVTAPYVCGYLPKKMAQSLIATPQDLVTSEVYNRLIHMGFRRSGKFAYRPHCETCNACTPVRVALQQFKPNRSQQRAFKKHQTLQAHILPVKFHTAQFLLYQQYQQARHAEGENAELPDLENAKAQYRQFLCQTMADSRMVAFSDADGALKIVSVIDILHDGISAVYTFYDTNDAQASYGTYAILWLTEWAKQQELDYLYLGYWIQDSPKMVYKQAFKPQQKLIDGEWV